MLFCRFITDYPQQCRRWNLTAPGLPGINPRDVLVGIWYFVAIAKRILNRHEFIGFIGVAVLVQVHNTFLVDSKVVVFVFAQANSTIAIEFRATPSERDLRYRATPGLAVRVCKRYAVARLRDPAVELADSGGPVRGDVRIEVSRVINRGVRKARH